MRHRVTATLFLLVLCAGPHFLAAQGPSADSGRVAGPVPPWYGRISFRGYAQARYNRLLESNERLICTQCDRSMGDKGGIFVRRLRFTLEARASERVLLVLQPDFTAEAGEASGLGQVRDAYVEAALDRAHAFRLRLGQTNVPYGWENQLSSAKRLPLDRADALNSAAPTERDLGAYFYWTPRAARQRYDSLARGVRKGTGDVGVVSVGIYNGQTANRPEQNNSLHTALRLAYPFAVGRGQVVEGAVQGYSGRFVVTPAQRSAGVVAPAEFRDWRVAASVVLHARPGGFQAEWNTGRGPEADPVGRTIRERRLEGGYVQTMAHLRAFGYQVTPYVRAQRYDGGKKFETDARRHHVREIEGGVEWIVSPAVELTAAFMAAERNTADLATAESRQKGRRLRLQAQFMF